MQDEACEFASFLLRYHSTFDYSDFSDDTTISTILRRYEQIKYSSELELLGKTVESLQRKVGDLEYKAGLEQSSGMPNVQRISG